MKFSFNSIKNFDNHIELSVPNYIHLIELIKNISTYFIKENTFVYDLGCSTGTLIKYFSLQNNNDNIKFVGIDTSKNLLPKDQQGNLIKMIGDHLSFECTDLKYYNFQKLSFATSIFTLQFLTIEDRINLLKKIKNSLIYEGALIVAEKIYMKTGLYQDIFTFAYYDFKKDSFDTKDILAKQMDLRSVMRPITKEENEYIFSEIGFKFVEFFRSLNFVAWILIKENK